MLLKEAKEILEKNGYRLVEAYDAVTDRNNIKKRKNFLSYFSSVLERVKNALAEEGIRSTISNDFYRNKLYFDPYKVTLYNTVSNHGNVDEYDKNFRGSESGEDASFSEIENSVILKLWSGDELIDEAEFDVRNTPSMVKWILDNMER